MQKHKVLKRGSVQSVSDWEQLTEEELQRYAEQAKAKAAPDALAKALAKAQKDTGRMFGNETGQGRRR